MVSFSHISFINENQFLLRPKTLEAGFDISSEAKGHLQSHLKTLTGNSATGNTTDLEPIPNNYLAKSLFHNEASLTNPEGSETDPDLREQAKMFVYTVAQNQIYQLVGALEDLIKTTIIKISHKNLVQKNGLYTFELHAPIGSKLHRLTDGQSLRKVVVSVDDKRDNTTTEEDEKSKITIKETYLDDYCDGKPDTTRHSHLHVNQNNGKRSFDCSFESSTKPSNPGTPRNRGGVRIIIEERDHNLNAVSINRVYGSLPIAKPPEIT